jgi:hypothetical protein
LRYTLYFTNIPNAKVNASIFLASFFPLYLFFFIPLLCVYN